MISVTFIDNKMFIKIAYCEYEQEMFHFIYYEYFTSHLFDVIPKLTK